MSAPKLHPTVRYAEPEYWDSRYEREPALFEWFFGHTALRRIIRAYISKKKLVLQIGCGTSNLQEGMAKSGYAVINTDISPVVINQMKERHAKYPNLSYVISDCLNMPEFRDGQFGHVIDKGTMDALLCCKTGTDNVLAMLSEVYRVLQPGGSFLLVTLGDPTRRLPLLLHPKLHWKVSLLMLPKISGAAQVYVDGKPINDTKEPIDADGPYEVLQDQTIVGLPADVQYGNYFFAYVCKKPTTPHSQGERVQLPNGWVAGSKEVFQKLQKEFGLPEDLLQKGRRKKIMHVPAGSKHGLPGASHSATSSSSSNAGAAAALGVVPVQDADRIMQEDQRHLQELTLSTPSVAGLQGSQRRHSEQLPAMTQDQHQPIQHTQQAQSPVKSASTADAKLDVLLNSAQKQQQQQQDGKLQNGVSRKLEVPARPQSAPNVVEIGLDGLPSFGVARRTFADAPASTSGAPFDAALAVHSPAAAAPSTAATATPKQLPAQAPATAEQTQQQQQHDGVELGAAKEGHAFSIPAAQSLAGSADTVHPYSGIIATGGAQDLAPGWSLDPPGLVAVAPRAPRAQRTGAPKVRRFSTECSSQSLTALQPQLAVLRQQQAQHSERATDGLVMHDVAASEALGSSGASVAAIAGAVWGHTRPPRDRRFSNMSIMSSLSAVSSVTNTEGEDDEESDAVQDYIPLCSGDGGGHVQVGQQEQQQQSDANGATSVLRIGTQIPSRLSTNGYGGQESDLEHQHDVAAGTGPLLEHRSDGAPVQQSSSAELAVESSAEGATGALQQQLAAVTLSAVRSQPAGQADSTSNGVSAAAAKAAALQPAGEAESDDVESATQEQTRPS